MNADAIDPVTIQDTCLCLHLRRAARTVARQYDLALAPVGLGNGQFSLMALVAGHRELGFQALADALAMDRTTLTAALKPLVRRGLLAVHPDPMDRRARRITLTADGAAVYREAVPRWHEVQLLATSLLGRKDSSRLRKQLRDFA